jgi:ABC-type multidrug transport system ATPase subunit
MLVQAIDGLNLTMYEGECFCMLGHNGAGKTTAMSVITGTLQQDSGTVTVLGYHMPKNKVQVRRKMGFCMQQNVLWECLTVEEHIYLFGALMGLSEESTKEASSKVLAKVGLTLKLRAQADSLSGGMKRKLNVALALLGQTRILILDEPTAGMDPHTRRQLWGTLKQLRAERIVCLTTHYMDEADELGDRICIMVHGRAACRGTNSFLKSQLGCGYLLNFVKVQESTPNGPILNVVCRYCGRDSIEITSSVGRELRIQVPFSCATTFPT